MLPLYAFLRLSTICVFTVDNMTLNDISVTFLRNKALIHSRKGMRLEKIEYKTYK